MPTDEPSPPGDPTKRPKAPRAEGENMPPAGGESMAPADRKRAPARPDTDETNKPS